MPEKLFGMPAWAVLLTLGAAGVVGYLIFFRNQGGTSSSGSTYSAQGLAVMQNPDESATMALQNQELSLLATQFNQFGPQLAQVGSDVTNGFSSVGTSLNGISGQVSGVSGQVSGVSGQVSSANTALANLANTSSAQYNELMGVQVNPWVRQWYENQVLATLSPQQQQYYWDAMRQAASGTPAPSQQPGVAV